MTVSTQARLGRYRITMADGTEREIRSVNMPWSFRTWLVYEPGEGENLVYIPIVNVDSFQEIDP